MWNKLKFAVPVMTAILFLGSGTLKAQAGFGFRAGVTADPNQFHFGFHAQTDPLVSHLVFRPNLEIGVGDNVTTIAGNIEFAYKIPLPHSPFAAYIGAGPALDVYRYGSSRGNDTHTGGGFNVLVGLEHRSGLFGEVKVGAIDSPSFKFTVGFTFK